MFKPIWINSDMRFPMEQKLYFRWIVVWIKCEINAIRINLRCPICFRMKIQWMRYEGSYSSFM